MRYMESTEENRVRERVRDIRERMGKKQDEFAEMAGVSHRTYQSFEAGEHKTQASNLTKILRAAGFETFAEAARVQDDPGAMTRESWPSDIRVFLDAMGAFLMTMQEADREKFIHVETRRIVASVAEILRAE